MEEYKTKPAYGNEQKKSEAKEHESELFDLSNIVGITGMPEVDEAIFAVH